MKEVKEFLELDSSLFRTICEDSKTKPEVIDSIIEEFKQRKVFDRYATNEVGWISSNNQSLLSRHIDFIIDKEYSYSIMNRPNITDRHLDRIVSNGTVNVFFCSCTKLLPRHIDLAVKYDSYHVRAAIAKHPNLQSNHLDILSKDKTLTVTRALAKRIDLSQNNVDKLLKKNDSRIRHSLKRNGYIKEL